MAAAATPPPAGAAQPRRPGRPPGSRSRSKSRSKRWSKPPKRSPSCPPRRTSPSSASPPQPQPSVVDLNAPLPPGTDVEVRVDDPGFHGAWFEATVLDFAPARGYRHPARYTVRYAHLLADDDEGALAEPFAPSHIRPRPPPPPPEASSPPHRCFREHDVVEAFHNEGWWSGIVVSSSASSSPSSAAGRVTVAFPVTREVIDFAPGLVRPRRDYVDGDWVPSRAVVAVRPARAVRVYAAGEKVEVVRQRGDFGESWFPATVRVVVDDQSYVVEYFDLEDEGEGPGKAAATEYLHWQFIRPAVEHAPREGEFQLRPGAAVEAYCDGAWSPGVVRRVLGDGEYEICIGADRKGEMLVTKVGPLLKPRYKWNGKQWRIATSKRRANTRQRSVSGKTPRSPVVVSSSDEEHHLGKNTLVDGSEHASVSEMDIPLSAICKSPESAHSPNSFVSEKNSPQGSHGIVNSPNSFVAEKNSRQGSHGIVNSVPMNGLLCASPGHVSGRSVDGHGMLSVAELKKMASACRNSPVSRKQENTVKSPRVNNSISDIKAGKTHPIQELQGKIQSKGNKNSSTHPIQELQGKIQSKGNKNSSTHPIQELQGKIQSKVNKNSSTPEIVLALGVSRNGQTVLSPDRLVSARTKRGSSIKGLACKKLANRRGSKELGSPNSSLDVTGTVQQREVSEPIEVFPLALECPKYGNQEQLNRTLEDARDITELLNQDQLPIVPPGFKSTDNGKGTQFDEEPTGTTNNFIESKGNGDICIDQSSHVMETAVLPPDCPAEQVCGEVDGRSVLQHAQSSQCTISSSPCSASESLPSPQPLCALFVKTLPMWHQVDNMHVFKEFPQKPHFLTLQKAPPLLREATALGMMLTFSQLVKYTMEASLDHNMEWFEDNINTISHLKENGFDVDFMQSTMTELAKIKSECTSYYGEIGKRDSEIVENTALSSRVVAVLDENDIAAAKLEQELGRIRQESQKMAEEKEKLDAEAASIKAERSEYKVLLSGAKRKFEDAVCAVRRKRLS